MNEILLITVAVMAFHVVSYYLISLLKRNAGIVDIGWGLGFVLIAWSLYLAQSTVSDVHLLITLLVTFWGLRLALHIFFRNIRKPEDWRYANWRETWSKDYWWRSLLQIFILQGVLAIIISAPVIVAANSTDSLSFLSLTGLIVWLIGFIFESVGDWQLRQFVSAHKNKGKIMTTGLWRYTRHPNYFGEVTQWWGLFLIVLPLEYGLFAIISPILITFLLLKVSGITMLEKKFEGHKAFEEYKSRTSSLIPYPPKPE